VRVVCALSGRCALSAAARCACVVFQVCVAKARRVVTLAHSSAQYTGRCTAAFSDALRCDAMRCDAMRRDATRCNACSRNHLSIAATTCTSSHERSTRSSAAYLDVQVCTTLHLACRSDAATYDTPHLYDVCHIRLSCMLTRAHGFILHVVRCTSYSVHVAPRRLARAHVAWCLHSAHKGRRLGLSQPVALRLGLGHRSVSAHAIRL
jgi:hypothetical protein